MIFENWEKKIMIENVEKIMGGGVLLIIKN